MEEKKKAFSAKDIAYILFKNKALIVSVFLFALVSSTLYCLFVSPLYMAETKIIVKLGKAQFAGMEQYRPENYNILFQERSANIHNEVELIKGEFLAQKVVQRMREDIERQKKKEGLIPSMGDKLLEFFGMHRKVFDEKGLVAAFTKAVRVTYIEDTDMLNISFRWTDPAFAALAANAYADEYITQHTKVHESKQTYRFYLEQLDLYDGLLKKAEAELQTFLNDTNIANLSLQKELLLKRISDLEAEYVANRVIFEQGVTKLNSVKKMSARPDGWIETPELGSPNADKLAYLAALDQQYFRLKVERDRLLKNYTVKSNEVQSVDRQLNGLRKQKTDSLLNIINTEVAMAGAKKDSLYKEWTAQKKQLEEINGLTTKLRQLERQKEITEANYAIYKKKAEDLRISDDLDTRKISSVRIVNPAIVPFKAFFPNYTLIIGLACLLGLFFAISLAAVHEFFSHTFKDDDDVAAILGIPLLMTVPIVAGTGREEAGEGEQGDRRTSRARFSVSRAAPAATTALIVVGAIFVYHLMVTAPTQQRLAAPTAAPPLPEQPRYSSPERTEVPPVTAPAAADSVREPQERPAAPDVISGAASQPAVKETRPLETASPEPVKRTGAYITEKRHDLWPPEKSTGRINMTNIEIIDDDKPAPKRGKKNK
ncbi:MAG: GumC family protein [Syntrophobacterales bacterium]|nr:GumC family protein [Syntrophobacterales bacterium]